MRYRRCTLGEFTKINFLDATPIGADGNGGLTIDTIAPLTATSPTASATTTRSTSSATKSVEYIELEMELMYILEKETH